MTDVLLALPERVIPGQSWTTDAPYRETPAAIRRAQDAGADCVEMESTALRAYAAARNRDVLCRRCLECGELTASHSLNASQD